jgi:putative phosphonate metabolism protein
MHARLAIYFAPATSTALWGFGSDTIGYDAASGADRVQSPPALTSAVEWRAWTDAPRSYGFHATLVAPFYLRDGCSEDELGTAVAALAERTAPFVVDGLAVSLLGPFAALTPSGDAGELSRLAAECILALDPYRAPLGPADRARRLAAGLTPRQTAYLDRYGYPYAFEEFSFHMTLAGPLPPDRRETVRAELARRYRPIEGPVAIDALTLFRQKDRKARFRMVARHPLSGLDASPVVAQT